MPSAVISGAIRGASAQRPVGEALDRDAERADADGRQREHDQSSSGTGMLSASGPPNHWITK